MSTINDRFQRARELSRIHFPDFSRRMRAKWVLAKLNCPGQRVPIASFAYDIGDFRFLRRA